MVFSAFLMLYVGLSSYWKLRSPDDARQPAPCQVGRCLPMFTAKSSPCRRGSVMPEASVHAPLQVATDAKRSSRQTCTKPLGGGLQPLWALFSPKTAQ